ncbi:MAG: hypothetical protein BM564_13295 [Bacteroidetes bacterium MedPE-SWsnd-G2]|nr:MAG: hypothetical protein BM564_13295 [Bacteroidetes bacterium MedPE-SWsnd-G2]
MKLTILILFLTVNVSNNIHAQQFITPSSSFSHEKTAYIELTNGTKLEGTIDDIDRKKGMIESITLIESNGEVHELQPEEVKNMYLPPSGYDKTLKAFDFTQNADRWNNQKLNQDLFSNGYAYFELGTIKIKKKNKILLMQLLNPSFCNKVKVYFNPYASETSSLNYGGIKVTGGIAKSYYVTYNSGEMIKLHKKNYEENFNNWFENCSKLLEEFPKPKWRDFAKHILNYSDCAQ